MRSSCERLFRTLLVSDAFKPSVVGKNSLVLIPDRSGKAGPSAMGVQQRINQINELLEKVYLVVVQQIYEG